MTMVVRTEVLNKLYGQTHAVKDLDLQVEAGEVYGFLGPNGAGKTTTLLMLLGMVEPTSGRVFMFGEEVKGLDTKLRSKIGVVPEHQSLYDEMTAWEYLSFFAQLYGVEQQDARIEQLLDYFDLLPHRNTRLGAYSHGMRQKVNICRGLLHDPDFLILDEPVLGLDPASVRLVRDLVLSQKKNGKTALISSHMLSEIEKTADRVGIMSEGQLVAEGTIEQVTNAIGGVSAIEIELEELNPTILERLLSLPVILGVDERGTKLIVQVEDIQSARSAVSKVISESGGVILNFESRGPDLEEAFLAITQGHVDRLKEEVG
ncbi:MAG: ATP-binding cassette domain-containing protein [Anaerolineales bacterium]|nr:ATP-binding cassette domain-containing protein [Anaerolineales bacterium]